MRACVCVKPFQILASLPTAPSPFNSPAIGNKTIKKRKKIKQLLTAAMEKKSFDFSFSPFLFFLPLALLRCHSSPGEDYTGSSRSIKKSDTFAIHPQHVAMETTQGCAASICKQDGRTKNRRMRRKTHRSIF